VLIVEDSWHIAKAMESVLREVGMVIAGAAATTTEAERLASRVAPKVAVVDIMLRDGMAFELIDRLHDLGVRVIVVSGFSTFSAPIGKAVAVLRKPFEGSELLGALELACS
jgi:DNA-binding response OmpR family regulator